MTALECRPRIDSGSSSASIARTRRAPARMPAWACRSLSGSSPSTAAVSRPALAALAAPPFWWIFRSYALLNRRRHARGMFEISPDHAIGLYFGLVAIPAALMVTKMRRPRQIAGTTLAASVMLAVAGAVHLGLVWTHLGEPITAALFVGNGLAYIALSQLYAWRWWRLASSGLIRATLLGYLGYLVPGLA